MLSPAPHASVWALGQNCGRCHRLCGEESCQTAIPPLCCMLRRRAPYQRCSFSGGTPQKYSVIRAVLRMVVYSTPSRCQRRPDVCTACGRIVRRPRCTQGLHHADIFHEGDLVIAAQGLEHLPRHEECLITVGQLAKAGPQIRAPGDQA